MGCQRPSNALSSLPTHLSTRVPTPFQRVPTAFQQGVFQPPNPLGRWKPPRALEGWRLPTLPSKPEVLDSKELKRRLDSTAAQTDGD
jgi:hypothetical protein